MRAGLCHTNLRRHAALHRLRDTQHMVFTGLRKRFFLAAGVILLPSKDPRLMQIVQQFAAHCRIPIQPQAGGFLVGVAKALRREYVHRTVHRESPGVRVVTLPTGTRRRPEGLRGPFRIARGRQYRRPRGINQIFRLEFCEKRCVLLSRNLRRGIVKNRENRPGKRRVRQVFRSLRQEAPADGDTGTRKRHVFRAHGQNFRYRPTIRQRRFRERFRQRHQRGSRGSRRQPHERTTRNRHDEVSP